MFVVLNKVNLSKVEHMKKTFIVLGAAVNITVLCATEPFVGSCAGQSGGAADNDREYVQRVNGARDGQQAHAEARHPVNDSAVEQLTEQLGQAHVETFEGAECPTCGGWRKGQGALRDKKEGQDPLKARKTVQLKAQRRCTATVAQIHEEMRERPELLREWRQRQRKLQKQAAARRRGASQGQ